MYKVSCNL